MNRFQAAIILYGLVMIGMGVQAYMAKASLPSLIAGGGVGILEIFFAALSKTHPRIGFIGAAVVALIPLGRFIPTLHKDGALVIYPALVGTVISVALALYLVGGHLVAKHAAKKAAEEEPPTAS